MFSYTSCPIAGTRAGAGGGNQDFRSGRHASRGRTHNRLRVRGGVTRPFVSRGTVLVSI